MAPNNIVWRGDKNEALAQLMATEIERYRKPPKRQTKRSVARDWSRRIGLGDTDPKGLETQTQVMRLLNAWDKAYALSLTPSYQEPDIDVATRARLDSRITAVCEVYFLLFDALAPCTGKPAEPSSSTTPKPATPHPAPDTTMPDPQDPGAAMTTDKPDPTLEIDAAAGSASALSTTKQSSTTVDNMPLRPPSFQQRHNRQGPVTEGRAPMTPTTTDHPTSEHSRPLHSRAIVDADVWTPPKESTTELTTTTNPEPLFPPITIHGMGSTARTEMTAARSVTGESQVVLPPSVNARVRSKRRKIPSTGRRGHAPDNAPDPTAVSEAGARESRLKKARGDRDAITDGRGALSKRPSDGESRMSESQKRASAAIPSKGFLEPSMQASATSPVSATGGTGQVDVQPLHDQSTEQDDTHRRDVITITQSVVKEYLLQNGYGALFDETPLTEPRGLQGPPGSSLGLGDPIGDFFARQRRPGIARLPSLAEHLAAGIVSQRQGVTNLATGDPVDTETAIDKQGQNHGERVAAAPDSLLSSHANPQIIETPTAQPAAKRMVDLPKVQRAVKLAASASSDAPGIDGELDGHASTSQGHGPAYPTVSGVSQRWHLGKK